MSYRIEKVVHEAGNAWVVQVGLGLYLVYSAGITHSKQRGTYHYPDRPGYALQRAIEHAERLAESS